MDQLLLHDYSFLPALMEDYGYYLIKKDLSEFYQQENEPPFRLEDYHLDKLTNLRLIDKKLGFISTLDSLVWEHGKYRVYIHSLRLFNFSSSKESIQLLGSFMGRMVLGTISKYSHDNQIHSDYVIVGTDRVYRADEKQRRQDVKMIHKVHAILNGKDYLDIYTSASLYPNVKAEYKNIFQLNEEEKKQYHLIGEKVCDISMIWQCGLKRRQLLRKNQIYSWKDPAFPEYFYKMVSSPIRIGIIQKMLSLATCPEQQDLLFPTKNDVLKKFPILQEHLSSWVFVDFETDFQKCIYLMGYYTHQDGYQCHWSDHLDPYSEKPLLHKIYSTLSSLKQQGKLLCYYVAENNFWKERCHFHKLHDYMDLFADMLDLNSIFLNGPFLIRNVFNFKLKNIASRLFELGYIPIQQPNGCLDGAQSIEIARQYFQTKSPDLCRILENYNQFDCQVLYELVFFLQNYYQLS